MYILCKSVHSVTDADLHCTHPMVLTGVGPAKGLSLIRQYGTIEKIIANNPKVFYHCMLFVTINT